MNAIWLGITGNIGTGKSTACKYLETLGAGVVNADAEAHLMALEDEDYRTALTERFGEGLFLPNGELNRSELAARLFHDPIAVSDFNTIVAPRLVARTRSKMRILSQHHPVVILDGALIFEYGRESDFQEVWLITAQDSVANQRLIAKGLTLTQIEKRRSAQWKQSAKIALASRVIANDGTLEEFYRELKLAWYDLLKINEKE
ncbi:MAG: dephospho-CoA kinase [bacterium]|nr:dephospho-CoA kinase [bacterium]